MRKPRSRGRATTYPNSKVKRSSSLHLSQAPLIPVPSTIKLSVVGARVYDWAQCHVPTKEQGPHSTLFHLISSQAKHLFLNLAVSVPISPPAHTVLSTRNVVLPLLSYLADSLLVLLGPTPVSPPGTSPFDCLWAKLEVFPPRVLSVPLFTTPVKTWTTLASCRLHLSLHWPPVDCWPFP